MQWANKYKYLFWNGKLRALNTTSNAPIRKIQIPHCTTSTLYLSSATCIHQLFLTSDLLSTDSQVIHQQHFLNPLQSLWRYHGFSEFLSLCTCVYFFFLLEYISQFFLESNLFSFSFFLGSVYGSRIKSWTLLSSKIRRKQNTNLATLICG